MFDIKSMAIKFLSSPEGQKMLMEFLTSSEGQAQLQKYMSSKEGKELAVRFISQSVGMLSLDESTTKMIQKALLGIA